MPYTTIETGGGKMGEESENTSLDSLVGKEFDILGWAAAATAGAVLAGIISYFLLAPDPSFKDLIYNYSEFYQSEGCRTMPHILTGAGAGVLGKYIHLRGSYKKQD